MFYTEVMHKYIIYIKKGIWTDPRELCQRKYILCSKCQALCYRSCNLNNYRNTIYSMSLYHCWANSAKSILAVHYPFMCFSPFLCS